MDTFVFEYFLKRILRAEKPTVDCRRQGFRGKFVGSSELRIG
jgi:hypothetical protein